jgi:multicomponent Na+:H+ antiporter subunit D
MGLIELGAALPATLPLLVAVPFAGAILAFVVGGRWAVAVGIVTAMCTLVLAVALAGSASAEVVVHTVGGWGAPLGIDLRADGVSAGLVLTTAVVGAAVSVYAIHHPASRVRSGSTPASAWFWPLWLGAWASMNALLVAADAFTAYICLELVTVSAVGLVILDGGPRAFAAALRYLLAAFAGSLAYLAGVTVAYATTDVLEFGGIGEALPSSPVGAAAIGLMTVGLAVKAALFPLHFWLPDAHSRAPAPSSAILSGLVVTAGAYLLMRVWLDTIPAPLTASWAPVLGTIAVLALLWGTVRAVRAPGMKILLAYSTVAHVGLVLLAIPIGLAATTAGGQLGAGGSAAADALGGGTVLAISHALSKAALFLAAGTLVHAAGDEHDDRFERLAHVGRRVPIVLVAVILAGANLAGLPGTTGAAGKAQLHAAADASGAHAWGFVLDASTFLTLAYLAVVLWWITGGRHLSGSGPSGRADAARPVSLLLQVPALGLALAAIAAAWVVPGVVWSGR